MTVKELIEQLEKQPPDALISIDNSVLNVRTPLTNKILLLIATPNEAH